MGNFDGHSFPAPSSRDVEQNAGHTYPVQCVAESTQGAMAKFSAVKFPNFTTVRVEAVALLGPTLPRFLTHKALHTRLELPGLTTHFYKR